MQNVRYDWLEQKMMADEFKQKLMDLGEEDFVMYIIQEAKKTVELVKGQTEHSPCSRCHGEMRIKDYENRITYSEDGMMPCPQCEGEG